MSLRRETRALFYSHDSFGLGHLRRTLSIAAALVERNHNASVTIVTGSPAPDLFDLPPRCEVVVIPCITKDEAGGYRPRRLPLSLAEVVELRSALITAAVRAFRPHIMVVDHTPTGPGGELLPTLRRLRHEQLRTRVVLGMRDVIDAPHRVRAQLAREGAFDVMRTLFDDILVYGSPSVLDVAAAYGMPRDLRDRVRYTGIVCPPGRRRRSAPAGSPRRLLASAGGGEDGFDLLRGVVAAVRGPMREVDLELTVVAGPLMHPEERAALESARQGDVRIRILPRVKSMAPLIDGADLVIGMGGYNSVYETLRAGVPQLVMPRTHPRQEQLERARRLEQLGLLSSVSRVDVGDPAVLAEAMRAAMVCPPGPPSAAGLSLDGAQRAVEIMLQRQHSRPEPMARYAH